MKTSPATCPRCGLELTNVPSGGTEECPRCGVVFRKLAVEREEMFRPAAAPVAEMPIARADIREPWGIDRLGRQALVLGFVAALIVYLIPIFRILIAYLGVLVHEIGHSATAWLFGYPSIPAFDFRYGGGVAIHGERSWAVLAVLTAAWGGWIYALRRHQRALMVVAGGAVLWLLTAMTPAHEALMIAFGHGAELLFATLFISRAASGRSCRIPELERPLYGMCGFFLVIQSTVFAWGLVTDPAAREVYAEAKGGGHWMDFSRLARDYLGTDLETVALFFLVACLATPIVALWLERRRDGLLDLFADGDLVADLLDDGK